MTDRQSFVLATPRVRANALEAVRRAPDYGIVIVSGPKRSLAQNSHAHALFRDIEASGFEWAGSVRSLDEIKQIMVSAHAVATGRGGEVVEGLEGELVSIRESTASMSVGRASSLLEYILAFCAQNGVELRETERGGFGKESGR